MNWIRILAINFLIFFALLGFLVLTPSIGYSLYKGFLYIGFLESKEATGGAFGKQGTGSDTDLRWKLPNYEGIEWAKIHFDESSQLGTTYYDFISWRREDFSGETINIRKGLRVTKPNQNVDLSGNQFNFFGGSTTWGQGVNDENTYPSLFSKKTGLYVENFGESGYISRQSLSFLINNYISSIDDSRQKTIVFYEGFNEVLINCHSSVTDIGFETQYQDIIRNALRVRSADRFSIPSTFFQLTEFIKEVKETLFDRDSSGGFNCHTDNDKAQKVAKRLVETWQIASNITQKNGDKFIAILQPVAFFGNPNLRHLDFSDSFSLDLAQQYQHVYPLIKKYVKGTKINFLDLTNIYDSEEYYYIDSCHVSPKGNDLLAEVLINELISF